MTISRYIIAALMLVIYGCGAGSSNTTSSSSSTSTTSTASSAPVFSYNTASFNNTNAQITLSTIDYQTGAIGITFNSAPDNDTDITIDYDGVTCSVEGNPGKYSSMVIDGNDLPHISYYNYRNSISNGNLNFASRNTAGNWTLKTLESTGDVGLYTSSVLYNNYFYITYYDADHEKIKMITDETGIDGIWKSTTLEANVASASSSPLLIESTGNKHIAFFKNCGGDSTVDLCYGTLGRFADIAVDVSGIGNGVQPSLALDENGKVYISYYDTTDRDLKYAYQITP